MEKSKGLYVTIDEKGNLQHTLVTDEGEEKLHDTTVKDEILTLVDWDIRYYIERINEIYDVAPSVEIDDPDRCGEIKMDDFDEMMRLVNKLLYDMVASDLLTGTLTLTALEDLNLEDDGTGLFIVEARNAILDCLEKIIDFHMLLRNIVATLSERKEVDMSKLQYNNLAQASFTQICSYGTERKTQYFFRSLTNYYHFLLLRFLDSKPNIAWCHCCGKFFYPATKKVTLYCDRIIENGKTCKQIGPTLKRKSIAKNDAVLMAYERTYQKMYKRYERSSDSPHPLSKGLTQLGFFEWSDRATEAKRRYLNGEISEEEALKEIEVND